MHQQTFTKHPKDTRLPPVHLQAMTRSTIQSLELVMPSSQFKASKPPLAVMANLPLQPHLLTLSLSYSIIHTF